MKQTFINLNNCISSDDLISNDFVHAEGLLGIH